MVEKTKENILKIKQFALAFFIIFGSTLLYAEFGKKNNIDMFPKANEGFERHVVEVPKSHNDYDHRIELLIGKNMMVDCNHHSFSAEIKSVTLQGWGYKYLEVDKIQSGPTTTNGMPRTKNAKSLYQYLINCVDIIAGYHWFFMCLKDMRYVIVFGVLIKLCIMHNRDSFKSQKSLSVLPDTISKLDACRVAEIILYLVTV